MSIRFHLGRSMTILCLAVSCALLAGGDKASDPARPDTAAPKPLPLIAAGTVIDKGPPKGWSHLILKSYQRAGAGDVDKISEEIKKVSGLLFVTWLANVEAAQQGGQTRYRLDKVAVGLGTRIGSTEVIVTPDSQRRLGANLRLLGRLALDKGSEKLQHIETVVASETMAVIDSPVTLLHEGKHRPVVFRYAVLVDAQSGRLATLLWAILCNEQGDYQGAISAIEWLPPNKILNCVLHVDGTEFGTLGIPKESAFALSRVHEGQKQLAWSADWKNSASKAHLSTEDAAQLEKHLRALLTQAVGK